MKKNKRVIIVDFGASNGRVICAGFNGDKIQFEEIHRFDNRPVFSSGTLYWDVLRLYSEMVIGIEKACSHYKSIDSLALDTWGVDFGFIDARGKLISNPVHYRDKLRYTMEKELYKIVSKKELFDHCGNFVLPFVSVFQLYALKFHQASEYLQGEKYLMMPDIFNYLLTGNPCNEYTEATTSLLCNPRTKSWDKELLNKLGIPESIFCEVLMPGTVIGPIQTNVRQEHGFPPIPVTAAASHDTASALAGVPVTEAEKNWGFLSLGTWAVAGMEAKYPIINDSVMEANLANEGSAAGETFLARNITGLWILQECREKWERDDGREISWDFIVDSAEKASPHKGFIDVDDPAFGQVQHDMPETINGFLKKTGQPAPRGIGETARIILESLTMKFRDSFTLISNETGQQFDLIHLVGGGCQNGLLCQWTANTLGIPVVAGPAETTAMGNALMQFISLGEIGSLTEGRKIANDSTAVAVYEPQNRTSWEDAYGKYQQYSSYFL